MKVAVVIMAILVLTGCSSATHRRESLSTVMEKAKSSDPEDRKVSSKVLHGISTIFNLEIESDDDIVIREHGTDSSLPTKPSNINKGVRIGGGRSFYSGDDLKSITTMNIYLNIKDVDTRAEGDIGLMIGSYDLKEKFKYNGSIETGAFLGVDGNLKIPIQKIGENSSFYSCIGGTIGMITWDYKNPLYSADNEIINTDDLGIFRGYLGLGLEVAQKYGGINFEIAPEFIIMDEDTRGGFRNDVFGSHMGIGFKIEGSMLF